MRSEAGTAVALFCGAAMLVLAVGCGGGSIPGVGGGGGGPGGGGGCIGNICGGG